MYKLSSFFAACGLVAAFFVSKTDAETDAAQFDDSSFKALPAHNVDIHTVNVLKETKLINGKYVFREKARTNTYVTRRKVSFGWSAKVDCSKVVAHLYRHNEKKGWQIFTRYGGSETLSPFLRDDGRKAIKSPFSCGVRWNNAFSEIEEGHVGKDYRKKEYSIVYEIDETYAVDNNLEFNVEVDNSEIITGEIYEAPLFDVDSIAREETDGIYKTRITIKMNPYASAAGCQYNTPPKETVYMKLGESEKEECNMHAESDDSDAGYLFTNTFHDFARCARKTGDKFVAALSFEFGNGAGLLKDDAVRADPGTNAAAICGPDATRDGAREVVGDSTGATTNLLATVTDPNGVEGSFSQYVVKAHGMGASFCPDRFHRMGKKVIYLSLLDKNGKAVPHGDINLKDFSGTVDHSPATVGFAESNDLCDHVEPNSGDFSCLKLTSNKCVKLITSGYMCEFEPDYGQASLTGLVKGTFDVTLKDKNYPIDARGEHKNQIGSTTGYMCPELSNEHDVTGNYDVELVSEDDSVSVDMNDKVNLQVSVQPKGSTQFVNDGFAVAIQKVVVTAIDRDGDAMGVETMYAKAKPVLMQDPTSSYFFDAHFCRYIDDDGKTCSMFKGGLLYQNEGEQFCKEAMEHREIDQFSFTPNNWPRFEVIRGGVTQFKVQVTAQLTTCTQGTLTERRLEEAATEVVHANRTFEVTRGDSCSSYVPGRKQKRKALKQELKTCHTKPQCMIGKAKRGRKMKKACVGKVMKNLVAAGNMCRRIKGRKVAKKCEANPACRVNVVTIKKGRRTKTKKVCVSKFA